MPDEERKVSPPESTPETDGGSRSLEDAPGPSERPEDRLGQALGDTADSVTRELRDLQDELIPLPVTPAEDYVEPHVEGPEVQERVTPGETTNEFPGVQPETFAAAAPTPADNYQAPSAGAKSAGTTAPEGTDDDRLLSMLAWLSMVILQLPIVSLIQLLSENTKGRPFQRHHAITSLLFYVASIVYEILALVVFVILTTATLGCGAFCLWVIFLVPHALALYYAFQAYSGKRVEVPYLSRFARQQGWL
ncbi:MAG: DUF4870 domain-containing protein [Nitrososphaerales archaeon]